jgi:hypothetical protein
MTTSETEAGPEAEYKPPYVSWATLNGLLTKLGNGTMPPRIDKGYLDNYSGGTQASLLATLRAFGLIKADGTVEPALRQIATDEDERKSYMRSVLEDKYAEQTALAKQNATSLQLEETFRKYKFQGSTLRKAIVFYLELSKYAEAPLSPHFKPPRQTPSSRRGRSGSGQGGQGASPHPPETPNNGGSSVKTGGEPVIVDFGENGKVTLNVDVRWLNLPDHVFSKLRKVIDELRSLAVVTSDGGGEDAGIDTDQEDDA